MKKFLLIPVIGILGALSLGAAASLGGINAGQVGASDAYVTSCDDDGVDVNYGLDYSNEYEGYVVDELTVSDINEDCLGQTLLVTLTNNGDALGSADSVVTGDHDWECAPWVGCWLELEIDDVEVEFGVPRPAAELVNDIHVAIHD